MSQTNRRTFMIQIAAAGTALAAAQSRAEVVKVDEKDPQAVGLGYVQVTAKADAKKFPRHSNDQKCSNCALYQGKPSDASGVCPLFGAKHVVPGGWCSAWAKKA